jgi:hypothetical protein
MHILSREHMVYRSPICLFLNLKMRSVLLNGVCETSGAAKSLASAMRCSIVPNTILVSSSSNHTPNPPVHKTSGETACRTNRYLAASPKIRNMTQTRGSCANPMRFTTAWEWSRLTPSWPIPVTSPASNKAYSG